MTLNKLHKEIENLIIAGYGRKKVMINKRTFTHPLESDGCCILPITNLNVQTYNIFNEDGGLGHGKNDDEKFEQAIVLSGE